MRIPKRYGQSRIDRCPFCQRQATTKNGQGVPVCAKHKQEELGEMTCVCGEQLLLREGKYGIYFVCLRCGNIPAWKVFEINSVASGAAKEKNTMPQTEESNEVFTTSDDPLYFS